MSASIVNIVHFKVPRFPGIVLPFVTSKEPNRGILQVVLMITAATCWLFWLCFYMAQMNPLLGVRT
ncbi:hypothetical protein C0J52_13295 [Blattella germanica]|nr:hypothetical protein C0J52_13295 [Blattella germanica]